MRIARRPVAVDYITLIGLWIVRVTFLTSGTPYTPPSLYQDFRNPIHDAGPSTMTPPHKGLLAPVQGGENHQTGIEALFVTGR